MNAAFAMAHDAAGRRQTYLRLGRRNRRIDWLRWVVPGIGILGILIFVAQIIIANLGVPTPLGTIQIANNTIEVTTPYYAGALDDGTQYRLEADGARVALDDPDLFVLSSARMLTQAPDGSEMLARAADARLSLAQGRVDVDGVLEVSESSGISGTFQRVSINWIDQRLIAEEEIALQVPGGGTILAFGAVYDGAQKLWQFANAAYQADLDLGLTETGDTRADISSDLMTYDVTSNMVRFSQSARLSQADLLVEADQFTISLTEAGALGDIEQFAATGGFMLDWAGQKVSGDGALFDPVTKVLSVSGTPNMITGETSIGASALSIDLANNLTRFGGPGGAVRIVGDDQLITGEQARFDGNRNEVEVLGAVRVETPAGTVEAPRLVHTLTTGISRFDGGGLVAARFDASDPADVTARQFILRGGDNVAEFTGGVTISQSGQRVSADRVTVHLAGRDGQIGFYDATGNVRITGGGQSAQGQRARYDPASRILRLSGNVVVTNESGTVSADELVVNLRTNVSTFSSSAQSPIGPDQIGAPADGGRVTGLFSPDG